MREDGRTRSLSPAPYNTASEHMKQTHDDKDRRTNQSQAEFSTFSQHLMAKPEAKPAE